MKSALVPATDPLEPCIEPSEPADPMLVFLHKQNRKRRRERQCDKRRDADRDRDRYSKLFIEKPGCSREESYRDKNRAEDEGRGDNGARFFAKFFFRLFSDGGFFYVQNAFDILDHDDRVVYDETRRERDTEQR